MKKKKTPNAWLGKKGFSSASVVAIRTGGVEWGQRPGRKNLEFPILDRANGTRRRPKWRLVNHEIYIGMRGNRYELQKTVIRMADVTEISVPRVHISRYSTQCG